MNEGDGRRPRRERPARRGHRLPYLEGRRRTRPRRRTSATRPAGSRPTRPSTTARRRRWAASAGPAAATRSCSPRCSPQSYATHPVRRGAGAGRQPGLRDHGLAGHRPAVALTTWRKDRRATRTCMAQPHSPTSATKPGMVAASPPHILAMGEADRDAAGAARAGRAGRIADRA